MNQFLKQAFVLFLLFSSISVFAQEDISEEKKEKPFNPKFTLGTGFYTLTGDIQNANTGILKGNSGYNAGMKFELSHNLDLSFLFIKTAFSADNGSEIFKSDVDAIGLHLGYTLNSVFKQLKINPYLTTGVQSLSFKTLNTTYQSNWTDRETTIAIPLGLGLRLNISERIDLDATLNYTIAMDDIDKSVEKAADKFMSASFTIHYDLFTPKPKENTYFDDSYYADVNFSALDIEDNDGDLVPDVDDYCPKTPIGVKVNESGCPLDSDNDGIPDYIDEQKNTQKGAIVDEKGVQLTADRYHSMYSDYDAASRKYANFYNENEIKRENYKTIDEYLIAKANAFNKAYNEGKDFDRIVTGLKYKVKIGEFSDGVPANVINKYLSFDDLESIPQDNGVVIYTVGIYNSWNDAEGRRFALELSGFNETSILVDNNGDVSNYVAPVPEPEIDEEDKVEISEEVTETEVKNDDNIVKKVAEPTNETTYRIQIGAYKDALADAVFVGVNNIISFIGKDGLVRYMAGSFIEYKDAIDYQMQMKARGFADAFIVTYKNGERISLNIAIKSEQDKLEVTKDDILNIEYIVQIFVAEVSVSAAELKKMTELGNIDKEAEGSDMYRYFAGTYSLLEEANTRLAEAKLAGFTDAFVFATLDGERITLKQAQEFLK